MVDKLNETVATVSLDNTLNSSTLNSTVRRGHSQRNNHSVTLTLPKLADNHLMEQIQDELLMKEQLMQKRYDRYVKIAQQIKEDVTKKNLDFKAMAEMESVQKF